MTERENRAPIPETPRSGRKRIASEEISQYDEHVFKVPRIFYEETAIDHHVEQNNSGEPVAVGNMTLGDYASQKPVDEDAMNGTLVLTKDDVIHMAAHDTETTLATLELSCYARNARSQCRKSDDRQKIECCKIVELTMEQYLVRNRRISPKFTS